MDAAWSLKSSNGWNVFAAQISGNISTADGRRILCARVSVLGNFWSRQRILLEDTVSGELTSDFELRFHQVMIDRSALAGLYDQLEKWLDNPREIYADLSTSADQSFKLSFSVDDRLISSLEKPACKVSLSMDRLPVVESIFTVDQSCIREFYEGLSTVLRKFNGSVS